MKTIGLIYCSYNHGYESCDENSNILKNNINYIKQFTNEFYIIGNKNIINKFNNIDNKQKKFNLFSDDVNIILLYNDIYHTDLNIVLNNIGFEEDCLIPLKYNDLSNITFTLDENNYIDNVKFRKSNVEGLHHLSVFMFNYKHIFDKIEEYNDIDFLKLFNIYSYLGRGLILD